MLSQVLLHGPPSLRRLPARSGVAGRSGASAAPLAGVREHARGTGFAFPEQTT